VHFCPGGELVPTGLKKALVVLPTPAGNPQPMEDQQRPEKHRKAQSLQKVLRESIQRQLPKKTKQIAAPFTSQPISRQPGTSNFHMGGPVRPQHSFSISSSRNATGLPSGP
jgi:hypothetical protein